MISASQLKDNGYDTSATIVRVIPTQTTGHHDSQVSNYCGPERSVPVSDLRYVGPEPCRNAVYLTGESQSYDLQMAHDRIAH